MQQPPDTLQLLEKQYLSLQQAPRDNSPSNEKPTIYQRYQNLMQGKLQGQRLPSTMNSMDIMGAYPQIRNYTSNQLPSFQNRTDDIEGARPIHKVSQLRKNLNKVASPYHDNPISPLYSPFTTPKLVSKKVEHMSPNYEAFRESSFQERQKRLFGGGASQTKIQEH